LENTFLKLISALETYDPIKWKDFSNFGLYMDQVLTVVNEFELKSPGSAVTFSPLTANMVNNYVKNGNLEPPINRKYTRDQILRLFLVLQRKQIVDIPMLFEAISYLGKEDQLKDNYETLVTLQRKMSEDLSKHLGDDYEKLSKDKESLTLYGLLLAFEASLLKSASSALLTEAIMLD
jgi:hypothetical protein